MFIKFLSPLTCFVLSCGINYAQHFGIELTAGPGFSIKKFTGDSLVFASRQGNEKISFSAHSTLLGKYVFKNQRLSLLAGVGLRFDQLTISRKNFGDYLGDIFSNGPEDTVSIKKLRIGTDSYTFPVGFEYAFKGTPNRRHHLAARLLLVPGKAYQVRAYSKTDSARQVNYPIDLTKLSSQYENQVSSFSLIVMPQLFFSLRIGDTNLSFNACMAPPSFDLANVYKTYTKSILGVMASVGFQYEFVKKR